MKISKELLAKYAKDECNLEEKRFVENWLDESESLDNVNEKGAFKQYHDDTWDKIAQISGFGKQKVIPFSRRFFQYAAAACIILGAFMGGRVTASSGSKKVDFNKEYENHLYLTGGNNLRANLPGSHFKLKFEGTLQLFNASNREQVIVTGDSTFVLKSGISHYLMGSTDKPQLIEEIVGYPSIPNVSYLSILRIDDK
ncbi:MAG: hypothetical protein AAGC45_11510 [Bacteroidota bacterium]